MQIKPLWLASLCVVALTGCGVSKPNTVFHNSSNKASTPGTKEMASTTPSRSPKNPSVPNANWILTSDLVKQNDWMTEYNQSLSINQGVYGKTSMHENWQLPSHWKPYLYKNEQYITPKTGLRHLNRKTLFITLQGTVYLKEGVAGRYWPPISAMDIPPDATIVAEFVPLKPAVKAGIIPVYHGGPQVPGARYIEPKVLNVLGMTKAEFQKDIVNPK